LNLSTGAVGACAVGGKNTTYGSGSGGSTYPGQAPVFITTSNQIMDHKTIANAVSNAIYIYANRTSLSNYTFSNINITNPAGFGVLLMGEGSPSTIQDLILYKVNVTNAGVASNRSNSWVTGIDLAEYSGMTVNRIYCIQCTVDGAFESAWHTEISPTKQNVVLLACDAKNAGKKPVGFNNGKDENGNPYPTGPQYGAGYLLDGEADIVLYDCTASLNGGGSNTSFVNADLCAYTSLNGGSFECSTVSNKIYPAGSSKTVAPVLVNNCKGIIITNGTYKDLVLYTTGGAVVTEEIELGVACVASVTSSPYNSTYTFNGTKVVVSFAEYAVIRLVEA
jgi:hypothetical protein